MNRKRGSVNAVVLCGSKTNARLHRHTYCPSTSRPLHKQEVNDLRRSPPREAVQNHLRSYVNEFAAALPSSITAQAGGSAAVLDGAASAEAAWAWLMERLRDLIRERDHYERLCSGVASVVKHVEGDLR